MKLRHLAVPLLAYVLGSRSGGSREEVAIAWPGGRAGGGAGEEPTGPLKIVSSGQSQHLSEGMAIKAAVDARLMGLRLLALAADVAVIPAKLRGSERARIGAGQGNGQGATERIAARAMAAPRTDVKNGGLAEAASALQASSADLRAARERMP